MNFVQNLSEIELNVLTLEDYLSSTLANEKTYAENRTQKGTCFFVYKKNGQYKFAPSRFIGYKNNTISRHENNELKDGRLTNPTISKILKHKPEEDAFMEAEYEKYCIQLGIKYQEKGNFGVKRKYWKL